MPERPEVRRSVWIDAVPAAVYAYFIDPAKLARWMGAAEVDAVPGGALRIVKGADRVVAGTFIALEPPHRLVFSFGWEGDDTLPPASSRVEVTLTDEAGGTRLDLRHIGIDETGVEATGWTHTLTQLASLVPGA